MKAGRGEKIWRKCRQKDVFIYEIMWKIFSIIAFTCLGLATLVKFSHCDGEFQKRCNACAKSLMDIVQELAQDLRYANRTIENDRLTAAVGFKLSDLESTLVDHSLALNQSEYMLLGAINTVRQLVYRSTNSITNISVEDGLLKVLENLDKGVHTTNLSYVDEKLIRNLSYLEVLGENVHDLGIEFHSQIKLLEQAYNQLLLLDDNYNNEINDSSNSLIEFDNYSFKLLQDESVEIVMNQSLVGSELQNILDSVMSRIKIVNDLARQSEDLRSLDVERMALLNILTLGNVFQSGQVYELPKNIEKRLGDFDADLESILTNCRWINSQLDKSLRIIDSGESDKVIESVLIGDIDVSSLRVSNKMKDLATRLAIHLTDIKDLEEQLNVLNLTEPTFNNLKNLTEDLANKTTTLTNDLGQKLSSRQHEFSNTTSRLLSLYREKTAYYDWQNPLNIVNSLEQLVGDLRQLNETLTTVESNICTYANNSSDIDFASSKVLLNDTEQHRSSFKDDLESRMVNFRNMVSTLNSTMGSYRLDFQHLNQTYSKSGLYKGAREHVYKLNQLVNETFETNGDILRQANNLSDIVQKFGYELDHLHVERQSKSLLSDIHQSMLMADRHSSQLDLRLSVGHLDRAKIANLSQFASVGMRKSMEKLREKIGLARKMLNRARWSRNFNGKCPVLLRNPDNLADFAAYSSINFLLKPDLSDDGLIFFVGTPAINGRGGNSGFYKGKELHESSLAESSTGGFISGREVKPGKDRHYYAEYLAIELYRRHISVILSLGSQSVDKIVDDVTLDSGSWHRISVVRTGTLLRVSIESNQSVSSLTRSLKNPQIILDLDANRSEIFVGGLFPTRCKGNTTNDDECKWPPGLKSATGFSGQVDDLYLNGRRLGLWDTVTEEIASGSVLIENSYHPLGFDWPPSDNSVSKSDGDEITNKAQAAVVCSPQPDFKGQTFADSTDGSDLDDTESVSAWDNYDDDDGVINDQYCGRETDSINGRDLVCGDTLQFANGYMLFVGGDDETRTGTTLATMDGDTISNVQVPLVSFSFKSGMQNSSLMLMQLANSTDFLAIQISSGQLELVVGVNETSRKQVVCVTARHLQQQAQQIVQQQVTIQPLVFNDHLWHRVECSLRVNTTDDGNATTTIHLAVDGKEVGQLNFAQQPPQIYELFSKHNSSFSTSAKRATAPGLRLLIGGGLNHLHWPLSGQQSLSANYSLLVDPMGANFTGCVRSIKWQKLKLKGGDLVAGAKRSVNVRERICQSVARMVSFGRPKSNISSSFVQVLNNINNEFDELLIEDDLNNSTQMNVANARGHVKRLTIRFKTKQSNGLLMHHSRPDHSSFMSIFISGGRLMLAVNFDKKIRIESHIVLSDGLWHTLYLQVDRQLIDGAQLPKDKSESTNPLSRHVSTSENHSVDGDLKINHSVRVILDDRYMYRDHFSVLLEPINANWASNNKPSRRRSAPTAASPDVAATASSQQEQSQAEKAADEFSLNNQVEAVARQQPAQHSSSTLATHDGDYDDVDDTNNNQAEKQRQQKKKKPAFPSQRQMKQQSFGRALNWAAGGGGQLRKVLYFGGVEDKYIPLLRNQQIPANFHGCLADVTINDIRLNFAQANKNQGVLMDQCQVMDEP